MASLKCPYRKLRASHAQRDLSFTAIQGITGIYFRGLLAQCGLQEVSNYLRLCSNRFKAKRLVRYVEKFAQDELGLMAGQDAADKDMRVSQSSRARKRASRIALKRSSERLHTFLQVHPPGPTQAQSVRPMQVMITPTRLHGRDRGALKWVKPGRPIFLHRPRA